VEKTVSSESYDELDKKIDSALDRVGKFLGFWLRLALVLGALVWVMYYAPFADAIRLPLFDGVLQIKDNWFTYVFQLFFAILFMIVQFGALFWFLGRARVYWMMPGEIGFGFKDYKGNPEILGLAWRIVTLLKGVKHFKDMGGETHRGLLMVGPPGTGKSYLAQCIATEAGVPFAYASAPSFQNMFMGIGNVRVMMLFGKARKLARKYGACIIFIDEIDAIGASRGAQSGGAPMGLLGGMMGGGSGLLNELLMQMDPPPMDQSMRARLLRSMGLRAKPAERPSVLTMGATNLPQILDPALLRPGRFDWKITIDNPDFDGRKEILEYYLNKVKHAPELSVDRMALDTIGYTPVAIKYIVNEAVVVAHFEDRDAVEYRDLQLAMEMYETGLRQPINSMNWEERRRIAYHEAGHAIAQVKVMPKERIVQLTIIRHGGALGYMMPKPIEEVWGYSVDELLSDIQVCLAGKAAEQVYLGTEFTGATSDLQKATAIAGAIIGVYGMHGTLYTYPGIPANGPDPKEKREIEKLLDEQFTRVKSLLAEYREAADELVDRLLESGNLTGDEVIEIIRHFEERRYGQASPETLNVRTEERMLNVQTASPRAGAAAAAHGSSSTDGPFGWNFGRPGW
jgi:cell division protease FtsH